MKTDNNTIKSPEEIRKLMEDLWLNHKAGNSLPKNNVFWVDLPPLTEGEKIEVEASKKQDDQPEDLYGVWI